MDVRISLQAYKLSGGDWETDAPHARSAAGVGLRAAAQL